ncbi:hypothetical protein BH11PLA2_BH11PLA2_31820 [soil metagenome]
MNELWLPLGIAITAAVIGGLFLRNRKPSDQADPPIVKLNEREVRLSRQLAKTVGCTPSEALPSIQLELELGENHPDETILKRAKYHYQRSLPEKICNTYRDRSVG